MTKNTIFLKIALAVSFEAEGEEVEADAEGEVVEEEESLMEGES